MVHRGLATLSGGLMICFLILSHYDTEFFLLHFYQSLIFLAIILMLFYFEERWAYMLGMLAPAVWLLLSFATGLLGGALRQVSRLMLAQRPTNPVSLIAGFTAALAIATIVTSLIRWRREFTGLGKGWSTFLVGFFIVALYYGILIAWFWRQIPQGPPG